MKFCYLDESGTGSEPYAVMVGIIVDSSRMHITKGDWSGLLDTLSEILGRQILEIHTRHFYRGNNVWHNLPGDLREDIISSVFKWLCERKHHLVYSAVDKKKFNKEFKKESFASEIGSLWRFMALHVCLAIQKHCQKEEGVKGHTVIIFDKEETEASKFIDLVRNPPEWTDTYYKCGRKQERLDQIIDVPYFVDSRHVALIQLADFISYFLRKHIEIQMGASPDYDKEPAYIERWINKALERSLPRAMMYPLTSRCECADLFYRYAPECILA